MLNTVPSFTYIQVTFITGASVGEELSKSINGVGADGVGADDVFRLMVSGHEPHPSVQLNVFNEGVAQSSNAPPLPPSMLSSDPFNAQPTPIHCYLTCTLYYFFHTLPSILVLNVALQCSEPSLQLRPSMLLPFPSLVSLLRT